MVDNVETRRSPRVMIVCYRFKAFGRFRKQYNLLNNTFVRFQDNLIKNPARSRSLFDFKLWFASKRLKLLSSLKQLSILIPLIMVR